MNQLFSPLLKELRNAYKFRYVTYSYINTSLKFKYRRSYLGFLWTIIAPMSHYLIMGLVFTMLMGSKKENYFQYYFSGALFFGIISGVLNKSIGSFIGNEQFIKKIYVPKLTFVINTVGIEITNFALSGTSLIILGMIFQKLDFSFYSLLAFIPVILASIALTGIACIISLMTVYFRDLINIIPAFIQACFFATPVIYDESMVPAKYVWVMSYNPIYYYLKLFRIPLLESTWPPLQYYVFATVFAFFCLFVGVTLVIKFDNKIAFKL